jgi:predicted amidohydrolase YtcJ
VKQMKTLYRNFRWWEDGTPRDMLVEDGRVAFNGPAYRGSMEGIRVEDLGNRLMYPSFVDNHCHILPTGLDLQKLNLGSCTSNEEVLDAVAGRLPSTHNGNWLHAVHYDQTKFGGVFLTRTDLDKISTSIPILLRHVNGHASVANSAALRVAGVADDATDPEGGSYGRDSAGTVNGVLFESAHERVTHRAPIPSVDEMVDAILLASERMADFGICCASDMMTGRFDLLRELEAYQVAAQRGCRIAVRLYLQWGEAFKKDGGFRSEDVQERIRSYRGEGWNAPQIAGIKIFADGAIGSATAAIYGRYSGVPSAGYRVSQHARNAAAHAPMELEVSGQLIYTPDRLKSMVRIAHDAGYQVAIHSIGDYSTDLVMDAYEELDEASRHRIEHAMILSDSQIERMAALGIHCSIQPEFLMRFGHSYQRQLGPERTAKLNRARSLIDAGVKLSFSSDRPIVSGNPLDGIKVATSRPEGFDPSENITLVEAVHAYTAAGAEVVQDSDFGALLPGQLAKFRLED